MLSLINPGDTINAGTLDQLSNILTRLAGQADTPHHYAIAGNNYTNSGFNSWYIWSRSRNIVVVSTTLDTSDDSGFSYGVPTVGHLTTGGAQTFVNMTAVTGTAHIGGKLTFQY